MITARASGGTAPRAHLKDESWPRRKFGLYTVRILPSIGTSARTRASCAPVTTTTPRTTPSIALRVRRRKVSLPILSSGLGKPIRRDSPAASRIPSIVRATAEPSRCGFEPAELYAEIAGITYAGPPLADDLGDNRHGDFLRGLGAYVHAERRMHLREELFRYAAFGEAIEGRLDASSRTDHPDEGALPVLKRGADDFLVKRMTARDGNKIAMAIEVERLDRRGEGAHDDLVCGRKPLAVRERRPIVDHRHPKPQHRAECRERLGDMAGAGDHEPLGSRNGIEKQARSIPFHPGHRIRSTVLTDLDERGDAVLGARDKLRHRAPGDLDRACEAGLAAG